MACTDETQVIHTNTPAVEDPISVRSVSHAGAERAKALRVFQLIAAVTLLKPFSNVFLAWGMRGLSVNVLARPEHLIIALFDPLVVIGIGMQIAWLVLRMSLLSVADLSFVLPVTAAGYVISTLLGRVILHEQVSLERWLGAILISVGAALVVTTPRVALADRYRKAAQVTKATRVTSGAGGNVE